MLLTVFYVAASWIKSRKLNQLRKTIVEFANKRSTIVFYKIIEKKNAPDVVTVTPTSSSFCASNVKGIITDVLFYEPNLRSCALTPQQIINMKNWILFSEKEPFPLNLSDETVQLQENRLFLLVEADCLEDECSSDVNPYYLNQFGIPRAWRLENTLGVIIESDIEQLTKICLMFMSTPIYIDTYFQVCRMQTVAVEGKPCEMIQESTLSISRSTSSGSMSDFSISKWSSLSVQSSPLKWKHHLDMLRIYSSCADKASDKNPVQIPNHQLVYLTPAKNVLKLRSPYLINSSKQEDENGVNKVGLQKGEVNATASEQLTKVSSESASSKMKKNSISSLLSQSTSTKFNSEVVLRSQPNSPVTKQTKPPNVLIFADSPTTTENIRKMLNDTLKKYKYTIYSVTENILVNSIWMSNCKLLVIGGNVSHRIEPVLISFFINGGNIFCLCSSFLHNILPYFRTAEVRERELVYFTYKNWKKVPVLHSVFCYQNSPLKSNFSNGSDEQNDEKTHSSFEIGSLNDFVFAGDESDSELAKVEVIGFESTWNSPSLVSAQAKKKPRLDISKGGRIIMSQVHLELEPMEGHEHEEVLRKAEISRKEIVKDILSTCFDLETTRNSEPIRYTFGYFLGVHQAKLLFLEKIDHYMREHYFKIGHLNVKFIRQYEIPPEPSKNVLPIFLHQCPPGFSTVTYFETLRTMVVGRLLIFFEVLGSTMELVNGVLYNGLAVLANQQTAGKGRASNEWLSPPGCLMFSVQLHFQPSTFVGQHPSLLQQIVALAVVTGLSEISPEHRRALNLHLKWPNDIYHGQSTKVGGVLVTCVQEMGNIICNVGVGLNLDNNEPTTCINKLITDFNKFSRKKVNILQREECLAIIFNQIEKLLNVTQNYDVTVIQNMYYHYWLHGGAKVTILDSCKNARDVTVHGIDEYGFLEVQNSEGNVFTVHPDGNSFDMMEGLIAPKIK